MFLTSTRVQTGFGLIMAKKKTIDLFASTAIPTAAAAAIPTAAAVAAAPAGACPE
jgi:hypothetical protein